MFEGTQKRAQLLHSYDGASLHTHGIGMACVGHGRYYLTWESLNSKVAEANISLGCNWCSAEVGAPVCTSQLLQELIQLVSCLDACQPLYYNPYTRP